MKRSLLLTFLLVLYIAPMFLATSSVHTAIPTEQNTSKEFQISSNWYSADWPYRKSVNINGSAGASTGYPVPINVTYDGMQTDFDDIRFTDDDGTTLLDHWLEVKVNDEWALFWVEVTDDLGTDQDLYMYYGNGSASSVSNGSAVFLFFDDFETDLSAWDTAEANWVIVQGEKKYGTQSVFGDADATGRILNKEFSPSLTTDFMIHAWVRTAIDSGTEFPMYGYDDDADDVYFVATRADDHSTYNGGAWVTYDETTAINDTWIRTELVMDYTNDLFRLWLDRVPATDTRPNKDGAGDTITGVSDIGSITSTVDGSDSWLDDYYVRAWILVEPEFDAFGTEEEYVAPQWNEIAEVEIVFFVPPDLWAWNMSLLLIGLCMVPASTVYLVYGGRNNFSTDKLFYGLILLLMGVGLIIGGIM